MSDAECDSNGDAIGQRRSAGAGEINRVTTGYRAGFWPQIKGALVAAGFLMALPLVQWLEFGRSAGERLATDMAMPMGLMWCGLTLAMGAAIGSKLSTARGRAAGCTGWVLVVAWFFLTLTGNKHLGRFAFAQTEHPSVVDDTSQHFESVVLLGGGIVTTPKGEPQLGPDGDRIRPVLQLWEAGRFERVIVTGTSAIPGTPSPTKLTTELLISLGVPAEVIVPVVGVNTASEMSGLKDLFAASSVPEGKPPRRALVTSAFHMPRALRLAAKAELEFEPLPTAFRSGRYPVGIAASAVPTAAAMDDLSKCAKEWLAGLLGR